MKNSTHLSRLFILLLSLSMHLSCLSAHAASEEEVSPSETRFLIEKGDAEKRRGEFPAALSSYKEALSIADKDIAPRQWSALAARLANLHGFLGQLPEAELLYKEILRLRENIYGKSAPEILEPLKFVGKILKETNRPADAEPYYRRALQIDEETLGKSSVDVAADLSNLAMVLNDQKNFTEAEALLRRALAITEALPEKGKPLTAVCLGNLAIILMASGPGTEAEQMLRRALQIEEATLGKDHPNVAIRLKNLGALLRETKQFKEAEQMLRRALAIVEKARDKNDPEIAETLINLAGLLEDTQRPKDAQPLYARALAIFANFAQVTGHPHSKIETIKATYTKLLISLGDTPEKAQEKLQKIIAPPPKK